MVEKEHELNQKNPGAIMDRSDRCYAKGKK